MSSEVICESCGCYNHTSGYELADCAEFEIRRAEFQIYVEMSSPESWTNSAGFENPSIRVFPVDNPGE